MSNLPFTYKLTSDPGNFRAFKILIAAEYTGTSIEVVDASPESKGKLPSLDVTSAVGTTVTLTESNAIARYVARLRGSKQQLFTSLLNFSY